MVSFGFLDSSDHFKITHTTTTSIMARLTRAVRRRHARETRQQHREEAWRNGHFSFQDQPPAVDPPATFGAAMAGYVGYGAPGTYYAGTTYYGYTTASNASATENFYGPNNGATRGQMRVLSAIDSRATRGDDNPEHGGADDVQEQQREGPLDDDDVGCMLRDMGEDCHFCGDSDPDTKPEKYGGKPAVRTSAATTNTSPIVENLTSVPGSLVENWLPGLGMPLPEQYLPKPKSPSVQLCNSCGVNVAKVESLETGPGHCPECRAR